MADPTKKVQLFPTCLINEFHPEVGIAVVELLERSGCRVDVVRFDLRGSRLSARVAYHPSCHLSLGLGIRSQPLSLLERIEGLSVVQFKDSEECCGFGGLFSVKMPEISAAMMGKKIDAIERAVSQLRSRRSTAFESLEQAETIRDIARRIKLETLSRFDEYLVIFEEHLTENGVQVHWAETGRDAGRIVLNIAYESGVTRIVKSKSMVTEEIHLNGTLIDAGLEVVETDFGEYIVQLAGDRPSHVILPIIHMTRHDVGALFHEQLSIDYTDDPELLARHARELLRGRFIRADMGVTGANFGVAESGTICLVSNEGNIRMVTTLPRVHVAILGIEKLVPTLADLEVFLRLLARSGTGQRLTAYTSLIRGPGKEPPRRDPTRFTSSSSTTGEAGHWRERRQRSLPASVAGPASTPARSTSRSAAMLMATPIPALWAPS